MWLAHTHNDQHSQRAQGHIWLHLRWHADSLPHQSATPGRPSGAPALQWEVQPWYYRGHEDRWQHGESPDIILTVLYCPREEDGIAEQRASPFEGGELELFDTVLQEAS